MAHWLVVLVSAAALSSCATPSFPPPAQYQFASPHEIGSFVNMRYTDVERYLVRDFLPNAETPVWRWAGAHPQLRFFIETANELTFSIDYTCAETLFRKTGPVTLTFLANDKPFGQKTCTRPGRAQFSMKVPPGVLVPNAVNLIGIEPDKTAQGDTGAALGFILFSAGFLS